MAFYNRNGDKKRVIHDYEQQEVIRTLCRVGNRPVSPRSLQEHEKKIRREIANSNERRRMQSINNGFQELRNLLPLRDEKLSKAAILSQATEYIHQLENEKTTLLQQNSLLKRAVMNCPNHQDNDGGSPDSVLPKMMKLETGDVLEDRRIPSPANKENNLEDLEHQIKDLLHALDCEKKYRMFLEDKVKQLESHQKPYNIALQDHVSYLATENSRKHKNFDRSPKPHLHNSEMDKFHEVPNSNEHEVPEDLSGRQSSPLYSPSDVSSPNITHSLQTPPPAFTADLEATVPKQISVQSPPRKTLHSIVEAIRHLEGDHMFQDDPIPPKSPVTQLNCNNEKETHEEQSCQPQSSDTSHVFTLQHQIIRNAPVSQSRPGVIVSKLS